MAMCDRNHEDAAASDVYVGEIGEGAYGAGGEYKPIHNARQMGGC
jgi:hypothetical protein